MGLEKSNYRVLARIFLKLKKFRTTKFRITCCFIDNSSDEFNIWHCAIKVRVTVGVFPFIAIQTVRSSNSNWVQARKL